MCTMQKCSISSHAIMCMTAVSNFVNSEDVNIFAYMYFYVIACIINYLCYAMQLVHGNVIRLSQGRDGDVTAIAMPCIAVQCQHV